ncbi:MULTISPECIES: Ivy family C-type lysozyme inhibitor [Tenebrionibacter/Tenebrionicola group]|jgi:hypothetical protein|uniref:Ivy family C-type lysozyme inhibitor n=2 Tax=Tenebrionibacter/Tenebrionicola group TaxID=2969848 RepID=A0A8K0Y0W7_9ENTR|nr:MULTISPECIES: Ivy family C-type lysozyme inhibitor [Tenebrionibacter/Tenebrionicola group]MBK4717049.1 Ivy family C-type lysozyme inhibitor [Tenebrionibacter intestinalis]MBV5095105.1 Ivy family C-type lysozyme inhibitor [Tenebrionicola larvae]
MLKKLSVATLLLASAGAWAAGNDMLTVSGLANGANSKAAFARMAQGHRLPAWIAQGGTGSPARTVTLGAETWQAIGACKPHNCSAERVAILWSAEKKIMAGVYSTVDEKSAQEKLVWMNVSDDLAIDGKTVLYATLTGSLENHPDAFNYK